MTPKNSTFKRFGRAVTLLGYAIGHVLHGCPDSARTVLQAAWDDLKDSAIGRIEHMATTAFVYAVDGNTRYAEYVLGLTLNELHRSWNSLPYNVRDWVWERCVLAMDYLPYTAIITKHVNTTYNRSVEGNYAEALYQLTVANDVMKRFGRFITPAVAQSITIAWTEILERMLNDKQTTTLSHVREFTARAGVFASV